MAYSDVGSVPTNEHVSSPSPNWEERELPENLMIDHEADDVAFTSSEAPLTLRVRRDAFGGDAAALPDQWIWQLFVGSDPHDEPCEAFVASFPSWVEAVEALHRAVDSLERMDERTIERAGPEDVADALSVRGPAP
jgi:hypothetical protein